MASVDWKGGKMKSPQQTKAILRHNDRELRENHEHTNEFIRKEFTHFNKNLYGGSYKRREKKYDDRLAELEVRQRGGKTTPVIGQGLSVPVPPQLMENFYKHATTDFKLRPGATNDDALKAMEKIEQWARDATDVIREFVHDENLISSDLHFDELHKYYDPEKKSYVNSFAHIHIMCVPENPDSPGKMSGREFSSRKRIIELNKRIEEMTQRDYGISWNTGEKKKRGKSVEELKRASEREEIIVKAKAEAEVIKSKAETDAEAIRGRAKAEAQNIIGRAKNDAEAEAQSIIGRAERDAEAIKRDAGVEAKNHAKRVFNDELEELRKQERKDYEKKVQESLAATRIPTLYEYATLHEKAIEEYEKRDNENGIPAEEDDYIP